ncbi:MAG TPA: hypothetical protein VF057_02445 [Thermoanaerobaculia bacterium]
MRTPSRAFVCSLIGIGMTLLAWFGPWAWPAWPAFASLEVAFGSGGGYHELSSDGRAAVLVILIVVNVAFWALISAAVLAAFMRVRGSRQVSAR